MKRGLSRALWIARIETVRHARRQREHPWRLSFELFLVGFVTLVVVGRIPGMVLYPEAGAYHYGSLAASGSPGDASEAARGFAGIVFVLVALVTMLWTMKGQGWRDEPEGLLTTVPIPALTAGDLLANMIKTGRFLAVAIVSGGVAFAAGSGSSIAFVLFVLGALALTTTATALGYCAGLGGLVLASRSSFVREHRLLVGSPLVVLYFGLFFGSRRAGAVLGSLPIGWYAELPMSVVSGAGTAAAGGALLGSGAGVVMLWWCSVQLAERAWLADGARSEPTESTNTSGPIGRLGPAIDRALSVGVSRETRAVTYTVWRRTVRVPQGLLYVLLPFVLLLLLGVELAASAPQAIPLLVAIYTAGAVGAGATLNPLGNEGRVYPLTATTPRGPTYLVRGYVLSAVLVGTLPAVGLTALVTALVWQEPVAVAAMAPFVGILTAAFVAVSVGIGTRLPEFDGLRSADSSGVTTPHVYAVLAYTVVLAVLSAPALAAGVLSSSNGVAVPALGDLFAGGATTVVASLLAGSVAYRSAVSAFERHRYGE